MELHAQSKTTKYCWRLLTTFTLGHFKPAIKLSNVKLLSKLAMDKAKFLAYPSMLYPIILQRIWCYNNMVIYCNGIYCKSNGVGIFIHYSKLARTSPAVFDKAIQNKLCVLSQDFFQKEGASEAKKHTQWKNTQTFLWMICTSFHISQNFSLSSENSCTWQVDKNTFAST